MQAIQQISKNSRKHAMNKTKTQRRTNAKNSTNKQTIKQTPQNTKKHARNKAFIWNKQIKKNNKELQSENKQASMYAITKQCK